MTGNDILCGLLFLVVVVGVVRYVVKHAKGRYPK